MCSTKCLTLGLFVTTSPMVVLVCSTSVRIFHSLFKTDLLSFSDYQADGTASTFLLHVHI